MIAVAAYRHRRPSSMSTMPQIAWQNRQKDFVGPTMRALGLGLDKVTAIPAPDEVNETGGFGRRAEVAVGLS
jgi:hypothetical protein